MTLIENQTYSSRVVFGKNSATMESQFVAQENAQRNQDHYSLATETVLKSTYMDDFIDSVENDDEGMELYRQLKALWVVANMQAWKWISNSPKVIEVVPTEERTTEIVINSGQDPITKTLGISWNSTKDVFTVTASAVPPEFQTTKRNVLLKVATIFDPLGFACGDWLEQLKSLQEVKIPRCLRRPEPVKSKCIVDASQQAYGAAVYMRCEYDNDTVTSRLIAAKSKVALLTPMTVPRLELMGVILGLHLTQSLLTVLEAPMQSVTFYSDSTDVLWWIRGRGRDFRPFVANCIGEIQMFTEPSQWQHVSTVENPADLCTREASSSKLAECSLWWNGPDWLSNYFSEWSKMKVPDRPSKMPEIRTLKRKEDTNACATLMTCNLQKETAPKQECGDLIRNGIPVGCVWFE